MYRKNIPNNSSNICRKFQEVLTIGQIYANPSTIEHNPSGPCKMLDFGQISESSETLRNTSWDQIESFSNTFVLCIY